MPKNQTDRIIIYHDENELENEVRNTDTTDLKTKHICAAISFKNLKISSTLNGINE